MEKKKKLTPDQIRAKIREHVSEKLSELRYQFQSACEVFILKKTYEFEQKVLNLQKGRFRTKELGVFDIDRVPRG